MDLVFNKVFTAEGEKNGKPWKRWDYKTADGQRYVSFKTGSIPLDVSVSIELSGDNKIESWKATGGVSTEAKPQAGIIMPEGSQPRTAAYTAVNGDAERSKQIHRQTAAKVAAKLLDFFPEEEQSLQTFFTVSEQLVGYFATGESIPF